LRRLFFGMSPQEQRCPVLRVEAQLLLELMARSRFIADEKIFAMWFQQALKLGRSSALAGNNAGCKVVENPRHIKRTYARILCPKLRSVPKLFRVAGRPNSPPPELLTS